MSESPDELATLLALARQDGAGPARLASVRARLESQLGPLDAPRPASPSALGPKIALGALAVLAVVALVGIRAWIGTPSDAATEPERVHPEVDVMSPARLVEPDTTPALDPPAEPTAPVTETAERALPSDDVEDHVEPRRVARRAAAAITEAPSIDPPPADSRSTLREEIALLDRALRAREAGDLARAVAALGEHRARFPSGTMSPERDRMLAELGRVAHAPEPSAETTVPTAP